MTPQRQSGTRKTTESSKAGTTNPAAELESHKGHVVARRDNEEHEGDAGVQRLSHEEQNNGTDQHAKWGAQRQGTRGAVGAQMTRHMERFAALRTRRLLLSRARRPAPVAESDWAPAAG